MRRKVKSVLLFCVQEFRLLLPNFRGHRASYHNVFLPTFAATSTQVLGTGSQQPWLRWLWGYQTRRNQAGTPSRASPELWGQAAWPAPPHVIQVSCHHLQWRVSAHPLHPQPSLAACPKHQPSHGWWQRTPGGDSTSLCDQKLHCAHEQRGQVGAAPCLALHDPQV